MTTQDKLVKRKLSLLELAEFLKNVSQACKINGVSRQHFYDIKKAYDERGIEGLKEKTRCKPCVKNRVAPEVEDAVVKMAYEYPAYGQLRASNELRKTKGNFFLSVLFTRDVLSISCHLSFAELFNLGWETTSPPSSASFFQDSP